MPPDEQRRSRRIHKRFVLRAALFGEEPLRWSHVTIHNLSSTGAYFTFDKAVRVGTLMHFQIDLPDRVIECLGRVRRLAEAREGGFPDVGANFEVIPAADKEYIDRFVEANAGR